MRDAIFHVIHDIAKLVTFESQKDVRLTYGRRERLRRRNQRDRDRRAAESAQQREVQLTETVGGE